ncbi:iron dicitrate transport regulator FecR [Metarhizobium album]|uniref:Iron dicitrate transport regulator FecR n=1 Tax=Metarhizobium album TaxID=2182425 RepID=A0A2U2DSF9_9HYPH|nr:FecR family protein [Rhizobium album]PWE56253.1 iron dicitrate transport regulator FecR [Rhizobium album]
MKDDDTDPLFIEALEWLARMQDDQVSASERARFAEWISASPAHADAYERAEQLWDRFEIVKPEYQRLRRSRALSRRSVVLGGLAALAAAGGYWALPAGLLADHVTDIGERRAFALPDGSAVELGSYSALSVLYTDGERRLILHRGQAFFTVAADTARPFVVEAAAGTIQALGTRFDVKFSERDVTVTVIEHSVRVTPSGSVPVTVEEGWQVSYDPRGATSPRPIDVEAVQAWRRDRIVFEDVPLRRVLRELERYRRGKIILMDDTVGDIPVTAIFDTKEANGALAVIAETLPVRVVDAAGFVAIVSRR